MKQLKDRESGNLGIALLRLNGQGEQSVGDWVCLLRFDDVIELLKKAGYGESN
jgi:hypothetical protein